ncbi:hypothetical protein [Xanthomonas graminis]|uniref:hypothetical protein n=1 Tax=Xanthomonas graminis TaxID=3390026 RepID=UPI001F42C181|nr:hypothetical protein [Xanthomonas translucens]UKE64243.1 hypothetical protein KM547_10450 [Xanthomonas translucens pv. phlei]
MLSSADASYRIDPRSLRILERQPQALEVAAAIGGDGQLYLGGAQGLWRLPTRCRCRPRKPG